MIVVDINKPIKNSNIKRIKYNDVTWNPSAFKPNIPTDLNDVQIIYYICAADKNCSRKARWN